MKNPSFAAAILVMCGLAGCSHQSRFHPVLRQYTFPEYRAKDRDLLIDFGYDSHSDEFIPESLNIHETSDEVNEFRKNSSNDTRVRKNSIQVTTSSRDR